MHLPRYPLSTLFIAISLKMKAVKDCLSTVFSKFLINLLFFLKVLISQIFKFKNVQNQNFLFKSTELSEQNSHFQVSTCTVQDVMCITGRGSGRSCVFHLQC
jgi:hypothetical protein